MNNKVRKQIKQIIVTIETSVNRLEEIESSDIIDLTPSEIETALDICNKVESSLEDVWGEIEEIKDAEEESFDNIPESLQESRQDQHDEVMDALDDALCGDQFIGCPIHEQIDTLNECIEHLQAAIDA